MGVDRRRRTFAVALATSALLATVTPAVAQPTSETLAEDLQGPLGLAVDRDGTAYVAESFGGYLTRVDRRGRKTVVFEQSGRAPAGVALRPNGKVVFTSTLAPEDPEGPPTDTTLEALRSGGRSTTIASLLDYETRVNPDRRQRYGPRDLDPSCAEQLPDELPSARYKGVVDSNPYAVAVETRKTGKKGKKGKATSYLVADAAGNSIVRVPANGRRLSTVAVLPPVRQRITAEAVEAFREEGFDLPDCIIGLRYDGEPVPTDIEIGRDGHYYVTTLPGFPEAEGAGSVWRIHRSSGKIRQVATGFSGAVDLAVARDGTIYVAELFANRVSTVRRGKVRTFVEVSTPGAIEIGPKGRVYVTTGVFGPDGGRLEVFRP
jgi:sugar lactone lactonase YvrE